MRKYIIVLMATVFMTLNLQAQYWRTDGNNIGTKTAIFGTKDAGGRNILISQGNVKVGMITKEGNFGFGPDEPKQKIHVMDGNILISASQNCRNEKGEKAPGSINGSLLFGSIIEGQNIFGKWGIEYETDEKEGIYGLNFWQPYNSSNNYNGIECNGPYNHVLFIQDCTGNIGIGTPRPTAKLTVNGDIIAKELIITKSPEEYGLDWPDFVFSKDYDLISLKDLENFINTYNHLPDVPSAKDIDTNGMDVMEMNTILLQKVEELSLYIINLQKQIDELKNN